MTQIYLLRHGETVLNTNASEVVGGRSNHTELTTLGRTQPRRAAQWLVSHSILPTRTIRSPAVRTRDTLSICLDEMGLTLPGTVDDRLQELSQGIMEGRPRHEAWNESAVSTLRKDPMHFAFPEGESVVDVQERMFDWLNETCSLFPDETILVAGHGLSTRILAGRLLGWSHNQMIHDAKTPNCSLTLIEGEGSTYAVRYVGKDIAS